MLGEKKPADCQIVLRFSAICLSAFGVFCHPTKWPMLVPYTAVKIGRKCCDGPERPCSWELPMAKKL